MKGAASARLGAIAAARAAHIAIAERIPVLRFMTCSRFAARPDVEPSGSD
jgi:hypothetical protein